VACMAAKHTPRAAACAGACRNVSGGARQRMSSAWSRSAWSAELERITRYFCCSASNTKRNTEPCAAGGGADCPTRMRGRSELGYIRLAQQRDDEAEQCMRTAAGLQASAPVLPYAEMPRALA